MIDDTDELGNRDELDRQIKTHIKDRGNDYIRVVKEVRGIFESYRRSVEGKNGIYEIRSRGDYQDGNELKSHESILKKIIGRKRKRSLYSMKDIEDIIGIRIICVYPSDVESITKYITDIAEKEKKLRLFSKPEPINRSSGYKAVHITVSLNKPFELRDLKCEIQIVTMLQEAWSFKSHDMVYKPEEKVEIELGTLTCCLSDLLTALDKQSEVIKSQIEKNQKNEDQRRIYLMSQDTIKLLRQGMIADEETMRFYDNKHIHFEEIEDPNIGMQLLKHLVKDMNIEGVNEKDIDNVINNLNAYEERFNIFDDKKNFNLCKELCRTFLLVAMMERTGKYCATALRYSDKLIWHSVGNYINEANAYLFKGRVLSTFKRYDEALAITNKAIKVAEISNLAKNNWAYFAAEYIYGQRKLAEPELTAIETERFTKKAFEYAQQAIDNEPDNNKKSQFEDTLGFLKIILGKTPEEVKEGLEICRQALQVDPNQDSATLYLRRHEWMAYHRLLELLD